MGEVFDKVGKRLGLPYPQGPRVDELAELGVPGARPLPVSRFEGLDFSYSGLKSQALLEIERLERTLGPLDLGDDHELPQQVLDLLTGFRASAVGQVLARLDRLHQPQPIGTPAVSVGVAANRLLRRELPAWAERNGVDLRLVPLVYSGDNAAMIAHAALLRHRRGPAGHLFAAEAAGRIPV